MLFRHPHDEAVLVLNTEQCWQLLEQVTFGRLVAVVDGRADIFPLNVVADTADRSLVFRTAPGTKLAEVAINEDVLFEADAVLDGEAWSVVVRGTAQRLETSTEIAAAEALGLKPWVPTPKDHYVRIVPTEVTGRHFMLGEQPERELGEGSEAGGD
ncbi:pyridoxamine 5'-phosphate oxidase family protein [Nesterenkonia alba]|uniref:pyridoxamine 5'-phosphate oxidase family protein n=1 Tax=Nesterenkonia alba TaxID=515814 RepID=UPI0003B513C1|nr:pyridoxamine 5'-phosphate oxidase family protein [Nesterenkonia alba]